MKDYDQIAHKLRIVPTNVIGEGAHIYSTFIFLNPNMCMEKSRMHISMAISVWCAASNLRVLPHISGWDRNIQE